MSKFASFHPFVNLIFFVLVICLSMFIMHPFFVAISALTAFCYSVILNGAKSVKFSFKTILPMAVISILINILTNRNGATVIASLPFGISLSREALVAGICTAGVITSAILWFSCFNSVITSEKLIYIFGKAVPSVALILSMALRFIPTYKKRFKQTALAQRSIGFDISSGKLGNRLKNLSKVMSVMTGMVLENSIDTADSMRGRGYGLKGKTNYNIYKFKKTDFLLVILMVILTSVILCASADYTYYPVFTMQTSPHIGFLSFFMLCAIPIIIEIQETIKWKYLKSKI